MGKLFCFIKLILYGLGISLVVYFIRFMLGINIFLFISGIIIFIYLIFKEIAVFFNLIKVKVIINNLLFSSLIIVFLMILGESILQVNQYWLKHKAKESKVLGEKLDVALTTPEYLDFKELKMTGANRAYLWMGKLHVFNEANMRRIKPFSPKRKDIFRITVVGDSLTYGEGVAEEDTYSAIIEKELQKEYKVEVLNLGVMGYQSEDILRLIKEYLPKLQPDLIIYGVCQNDFLPSEVEQYDNNMAYKVPLPREFKDFFIKRTLTGQFLNDKYNRTLLRLHLRDDFQADILKDFYNYQTRFANNAEEISNFALENNVPIVAMVLDQNPSLKEKAREITLIAEKILKEAGIMVIPTDDYYQQYDGRKMAVNVWEGHPNEQAHRIFADYFLEHLKMVPELRQYRIKND